MVKLDGFYKDFSKYYILNSKFNKKDASYYSLIIGLTDYFDTYHPERLNDDCDSYNEVYINEYYESDSDYTKNVINVFIHLQHFLELQVKKELENINILMSSRVDDPLLLEKILNKADLTEEETMQCYSVEMSDALKRLGKLVNNGSLSTPAAKVLQDHRPTIEFVTTMRNRIMHRGISIMKYCQLDLVMSQHVLPLLKDLLNCSSHSDYNKTLNGYIITDLIEPIIVAGSKTNVDFSEIALYKAFGKSKMNKKNNEPDYFGSENLIQWTESLKRCFANTKFGVSGFLKCPCCDNETLAVINDIVDGEEVFEELGDEQIGVTPIHGWVPIYGQTLVSCANCGLTLSRFIKELYVYDPKYSNYKIWVNVKN